MLTSPAKAPDLTLRSLDGSEVALHDLWRAGPVLLVFFKIGCPTCQLIFPFLERIHRGKGVRLVAISQDDAENTRAFHSRFGITIPTLLDMAPYGAGRAYDIKAVPSLFLVDEDGRIAWSDAGFDRSTLEQWGREAGVEAFVQDEKVPAFQAG